MTCLPAAAPPQVATGLTPQLYVPTPCPQPCERVPPSQLPSAARSARPDVGLLFILRPQVACPCLRAAQDWVTYTQAEQPALPRTPRPYRGQAVTSVQTPRTPPPPEQRAQPRGPRPPPPPTGDGGRD